MSWSRAFDEPIPLPRGRQIVTLKDAANYIQKLPRAEQDLEEWQAAVEALLLVVELNGPTIKIYSRVLRHGYGGRRRAVDSNRDSKSLRAVRRMKGVRSGTFVRLLSMPLGQNT
jgi:hypothetical protein